MFVDFLLEGFERNQAADAMVWKHSATTYGTLLAKTRQWQAKIEELAIPPGAVVIVEAEYSPTAIALLLALVSRGVIVVPISSAARAKRQEFIEIAQGEWSITLSADDEFHCTQLGRTANHPLYSRLKSSAHPGLVVFSSGSTGKSKGAVHDFVPLLEKFRTPRKAFRTVPFLLFDHLGGVNTVLYTLSNGGCIVTVSSRTPDGVLAHVEQHKVELLPTSPTFINLIIISEAYKRHDLSSLKVVTYGTEPMPESTLKRFHALFPDITLQQTYGLSEIGVLRSKSKSSDSLWVKVGGSEFQTRVIDGILHIKGNSVMLGYLNAENPFTDDGWLNTGDRVLEDGEYIRILGRESEIINVGGEKVYPAEVESVIQEMENVADVAVFKEANIFTGNIPCARVTLKTPEDAQAFTHRLKQYCSQRLDRYKIPVKVRITEHVQYSERFKRMRGEQVPAAR